MGGYNRGHW